MKTTFTTANPNIYARVFTNEDFFKPFSTLANELLWGKTNIPCNIYFDEDSFYFDIILPGISKEEINVELDNKLLSVKILKQDTKNYITQNWFYNSESQYDLSKLEEEINSDDIKTNLSDGILTLTFPKKKKNIKNINIK